MAAQPLTQRVVRAAGEGWSCLFAGMHLALKMVSTSFGGAAGYGEWAFGTWSAPVRTPDALAAWPLRRVDRSTTWSIDVKASKGKQI